MLLKEGLSDLFRRPEGLSSLGKPCQEVTRSGSFPPLFTQLFFDGSAHFFAQLLVLGGVVPALDLSFDLSQPFFGDFADLVIDFCGFESLFSLCLVYDVLIDVRGVSSAQVLITRC